MKKTLLAGLAVLGIMLAACAAPQREFDSASMSRPAPSAVWRTPTQLDLTLKHSTEVSAWRSRYFPDAIIQMEALAPETGEMLLVGGYALAVRGIMPGRRDVLEIVDDVMLDQQLATLLLQQAAPLGPDTIAAVQPVRVDESDAPIGTETTNTARHFSAPWKLRGELRRTAGGIAFNLQFDAYPTGATTRRNEKYALSGIWQQQTPAPRLEDSFSLKGWSVYRIRMGTRDAGGISIAAYVTSADSRRYQTLGELRAALPGAGGKQ